MARKSPKNSPVIVFRVVDNKLKQVRYDNFKQAVMYTAMSLVDNGYATKREAQEWQAEIKDFGLCKFQETRQGGAQHVFDIVPYETAEDDAQLPYMLARWNLKDGL